MNQIIEPMLRPLTRWAEPSQQQACRNAMVASTALAAGRRERDEAQQFIDTSRPTSSPSRRRTSHLSLRPGSAEVYERLGGRE